jgi:ATP-dependent helicase/nuclease subunit B
MSKTTPSVFTIAPGSRFLHVLAEKIMAGFPLAKDEAKPPLSSWTILLPTRRAARELATIFASLTKSTAVLLPSIKPIGDLDEDRILSDDFQSELPAALPKSGQLLTMMSLLDQWASENPQISLAQEITNSTSQSLNLALSLLQLLEQVETQETNFDRLPDAYDADLSEHRGAILSLINLLKVDLQKKLHDEELLIPAARRSKLIRMEAQRIERGLARGPLIAAGSTGTIPATRTLLKAIAENSNGAIVLPGLDLLMDDLAWSAITPEHPQYSLQLLLADIGIQRDQVKELGANIGARNWLGSELMRPSATTEKWNSNLQGRGSEINSALDGLQLIESADHHGEARAIALILREALEHNQKTAAVITPDRDLARRVKAELQRWNISIDDSAGEPLAKFGLASLTLAIINAHADGFSAARLLSILSHADCNFGLDRSLYLKILGNMEIAILRNYGNSSGLDGLKLAYERTIEARRRNQRTHASVASLSDDDWAEIYRFVLQVIAVLKPLGLPHSATLSNHLDQIVSCVESLAPEADWSTPENQKFAEIIFDLKSQSHHNTNATFSLAGNILNHLLQSEPLRTRQATHQRIAIYGVLEARLISADITILAGLNEGKWPAQPDPGPWLNRTMRTIFGMQQPERDIGVSAHDFIQGFGNKKVYLTWSKRIGGSPQIPSRWILRLQTVLKVANIDVQKNESEFWIKLASEIDSPDQVAPWSMPKPTPPLTARPSNFSVSTIEKLIRDPYHVYASKILRLEPLQPLAKLADASLRGILFHEAIDRWNRQQQESIVELSSDLLLAEGTKASDPFMNDPDIAVFWRLRFARIAKWLANSEPQRRKDVTRVYPELDGRIEFEVAGCNYALTARADRIDILRSGRARIIDYKSGTLPTKKQMESGMKPQLPLEAMILAEAGFSSLGKVTSDELVILSIAGREEEGEEVILDSEKRSVAELGASHFASLKGLLQKYQSLRQAYYPRANMFKEDEVSDYDHLSRYAEWILAAGE